MAVWCLCRAFDTLELLPHSSAQDLKERLSISEQELDQLARRQPQDAGLLPRRRHQPVRGVREPRRARLGRLPRAVRRHLATRPHPRDRGPEHEPLPGREAGRRDDAALPPLERRARRAPDAPRLRMPTTGSSSAASSTTSRAPRTARRSAGSCRRGCTRAAIPSAPGAMLRRSGAQRSRRPPAAPRGRGSTSGPWPARSTSSSGRTPGSRPRVTSCASIPTVPEALGSRRVHDPLPRPSRRPGVHAHRRPGTRRHRRGRADHRRRSAANSTTWSRASSSRSTSLRARRAEGAARSLWLCDQAKRRSRFTATGSCTAWLPRTTWVVRRSASPTGWEGSTLNSAVVRGGFRSAADFPYL